MMGRQDIGNVLPSPAPDAWKFVRALPDFLFRDMVLSDYYHVEEFIEEMGKLKFTVHETPHEDEMIHELL